MPTKERRDTDVNDNEDSSRWIPLEALSKQSAGIGTGGLKVLKVFWPGVDEKRKVTDFIEDATRFEYVSTIAYDGDVLNYAPFADF
jgi:hypothetical protein